MSEVCEIGKEHNISDFGQMGDWCDRSRLEAKELYHFVSEAIKLKKNFQNVFGIEGNHDKFDNQISIISFLNLIGIRIFPGDELYLKTPFGNILLGHWFIDKSKDSFGTHHKYNFDDLTKRKPKFDYCFLGHQHDYQKIENIYHIGSARYVSFGENSEMKKKFVILNKEGLKFIDLKSVIPIYNVSSIKELEKVPARAKVRYTFKSFSSLKDDMKKVEILKPKFHFFKKKIDFSVQSDFKKIEVKTDSPKLNNKEIVYSWLNQLKDNELRNILEEEFKKELLK